MRYDMLSELEQLDWGEASLKKLSAYNYHT